MVGTRGSCACILQKAALCITANKDRSPLSFHPGLLSPTSLYPDWSTCTTLHHPSSWSYPEPDISDPAKTQHIQFIEVLKKRKFDVTFNQKVNFYFATFLILPVVKFQTSMKPSTEPVTRYWPSGENLEHSTWDFWPNCTETEEFKH